MTDANHSPEITPAMAEAGARVLAERYDSFGDRVDELVAMEVFRSMAAVALSVRSGAPLDEDVAS